MAGNPDFGDFSLSEEHQALRDAVRDLAASRGVAVVITDHHALTCPLPASAAAVVYPEHPETPGALRHLCGAGVAFKIAHQLARRHLDPDAGRALVQRLLPMAAIATVAQTSWRTEKASQPASPLARSMR